ncbi:MAG: MJ1244 family protein [Methanothrix sp.]|uniref:MJ1244 family protein n=1 Tax=Methanothrix sp. TaxID=90426 RepID=UPI0025ED7C5C|nr:MJ1244 family protein [Methanothrix sp.]MBK7386284.1 MJ1244 family protein [Methanothrix sp.]
MKTMVKIFVDHEHLVRVINSLTELGITGFYLVEYQGMAPANWKSFRLSEKPDMALKAIRDHSEPGVMVNTVVSSDKCQQLIRQLEEALKGIRFTIIGHQVSSIKVKGDESTHAKPK